MDHRRSVARQLAVADFGEINAVVGRIDVALRDTFEVAERRGEDRDAAQAAGDFETVEGGLVGGKPGRSA